MPNSAAPNEVQYRVCSDLEWGQIMRSDTIETLKIPTPKWDVWKCSECQRIYVFDMNGKVALYLSQIPSKKLAIRMGLEKGSMPYILKSTFVGGPRRNSS